MITVMTRRLDRVTLVRASNSHVVEQAAIASFGIANDYAKNGDLKKQPKKHRTIFTKSYPGTYKGTGVSFDFFSINGKLAIAISCNPSKLSDDDWADFLGMLEGMFDGGPSEVWSSFKLSKLEVAMDVKVPLQELVCVVPKITEVNQQYQAKGTLYLGHKYGARSYCIYNKRKQLLEKKAVDLDHDLSRVEVRLRNIKKPLGEFSTLCQPFGNLLVVRKSSVIALQKKTPTSIELNVFSKGLLAGGVAQNIYLDMDSYSRKLLLKRLKSVALNLNGTTDNWNGWVKRQAEMLESRFLGKGI